MAPRTPQLYTGWSAGGARAYRKRPTKKVAVSHGSLLVPPALFSEDLVMVKTTGEPGALLMVWPETVAEMGMV